MNPIFDIYLKKYSNLIHQESHFCFSRLPDGYMEYKDIFQEGKIVLMMVLRKRLNPRKGKFITLLTVSLKNRFQKLIREAYAKKRLCITAVDPDSFNLIPSKNNQQKIMERKEALERIRNIDEDLANIIEHGIPTDLFIFARNKARQKAYKNGTKIKKITFDQKTLEQHYNKCFAEIFDKLLKIN